MAQGTCSAGMHASVRMGEGRGVEREGGTAVPVSQCRVGWMGVCAGPGRAQRRREAVSHSPHGPPSGVRDPSRKRGDPDASLALFD